MATTRFTSVDEYLASQPAPARAVLKRVRSTIRKAAPAAEETISYGIPTYKVNGRVVIYFAGWKEHMSLYPSTSGVVAAFAEALARYEVEKGTIRFPLSEPVPLRLIAGIVRLRAKEVAERDTKKRGLTAARRR